MFEASELFLVLGMHRGGTSLITRSLASLGISLGDNLLPGVPGINDKGFFEDRDFHDLNLSVFEFFNRSALDVFEIDFGRLDTNGAKNIRKLAKATFVKWQLVSRRFAIKDPRAARLMPFWGALFDEVEISYRCVVAHRHPSSVVRSMVKLYDMPEVNIYYLWLIHMVESFLAAGVGGVAVSYEYMVEQPAITMEALQVNLGIYGESVEVENFCSSFIDGKLQRNGDDAFAGRIPGLICELNDLISRKFVNGSFVVDQVFLDEIYKLKLKISNDIIPIYEFNNLDFSIRSTELDCKGLTLKVEKLNIIIAERDKAIQAQAKLIDEGVAGMGVMERMIRERDEAIQAQAKLIDEGVAGMSAMEQMIRERDEAIQGQAKLIDEGVAGMSAMERMIRERDEAIQAQAKLIDEGVAGMSAMEQMIHERDEVIQAQVKLIDEGAAGMSAMERMIRERDEAIQAQAKLIDEGVAGMSAMEQMIHERDEVIQGQVKLIDEGAAGMSAMERMIRGRDETIQVQRSELDLCRPKVFEFETLKSKFFIRVLSFLHII